MKLDIAPILTKLQTGVELFKRYHVTIFIVTFLGIYTFLVVRVNSLINSEPGPEALTQQVQAVQRLKIDQSSIDRILELEEQNIEVRSLFKQARNNPFTE